MGKDGCILMAISKITEFRTEHDYCFLHKCIRNY